MPQSPLVAILLVASSPSGCHLLWSWPPRPRTPVRLARPFPVEWENEPDVSWRAAHDLDQNIGSLPQDARDRIYASMAAQSKGIRLSDYEWRRPGTGETRVYAYQHSSSSRPPSGKTSPVIEAQGTDAPAFHDDLAFGEVLGYPPNFLAEVLSPKRSLCHQKFELIVDELAFIGHPVHIRGDGSWGYDEAYSTGAVTDSPGQRGRPKDRSTELDPINDISVSPELPLISPTQVRSASPPKKRSSNALHSFHLVLVFDRPDPSSVTSSDIYKFVDIYYKQIAFKLTAAMHYEQGRDDFVTREALNLITLKDTFISRGSPGTQFQAYVDEALKKSTLAAAIKEVFECISTDKIAQVKIGDIVVQVQLPPNHLSYLSRDSEEFDEAQALRAFQLEEAEYTDDDLRSMWLDEINYGWKLPPLLPWKGILVLDGDGSDPVETLWNDSAPADLQGDQNPKEMLRRFIQIASPTLSLSDIAALLDLDLHSEVYLMARLLVYNRKAKIIDVIRSSLKNIYVPPRKFTRPIQDYAHQFSKAFPPPIPSLPVLLSALSTSHQAFSAIVPSVELRPMYTEVLIWMLQRDLLIMLHVRIRIMATAKLKERVAAHRKAEKQDKTEEVKGSDKEMDEEGSSGSGSRSSSQSSRDSGDYQEAAHREASDSPGIDITFESSSPEVARTLSNATRIDRRGRSRPHEHHDFRFPEETEEDDSDGVSSGEDWDESGPFVDTIIDVPAKATPTQRRWIEAMKEGKDEGVKDAFERLHVYFDGKKTTDEILYRAEVSRRQLRDVLHDFEEYLIPLLHS